jgi:phosphoglucosamine mutase
LRDAVQKYRADIGIALDGDGDRLGMIDHRGNEVDGDEAIAIIAHDRLKNGKIGKHVVGTLMSNLGLEKAIEKMGLQFHRANVGDRYVMQMMNQTGAILGGESSGHVIVYDRIPTGDGIIAALQVLAAMINSDKSLYKLKKVMTKYPQTLVNVRVQGEVDLEDALIQAAVAEVEEQLGERGRVLLRKSGTEPLIRVMVEGEDELETMQLAEKIAAAVRTV